MERLRSSTELRWRALLFAGFAVAGLLVRSTNSTAASGCQGTIGEWHQIYWYSVVLILTAQMSNTVREFFVGEGPGLGDHIQYFLLNKPYAETKEEVLARDQVGFWTLMPSAFITWIFAKSINNAAVWGGMFGVVGGLAYAGIPVTHRDVNQSVTFVTGHDQSGNTPGSLDWDSISKGSQVIVIYMGMKHAAQIADKLIGAGRPATEPVAVVTTATTPDQQVLETTLGTLVADIAASVMEPPAIICVGRSVLMRQVLDWQSMAAGDAPRNLDPLGRGRPAESA